MVDLAGARVVAILTRAPSSGGKSRLFAELGRAPDAALLTALLIDTVDAVDLAGITRLVAVEPPEACADVRGMVPGIEVIAQGDGTLGERMAAVMRAVLQRGARAVAIIGSDIPDLPSRVVADAFAVLDRDPQSVAIGPAADGGYYLVAATAPPPIFDGIDWGTGEVLAQTLARAGRERLAVHLLSEWRDVDDVATLVRVSAPRTRAWVRTHL